MEETVETPVRISRHRFRKLSFFIGCLVILLLVAGFVFCRHTHASPVPPSVRKSVSFAVYYPTTAKLPKGYSLDTKSFRIAESGVVVYSVSYGNGRNMVVSEEAQPAGDVISKFVSSAIPINNTLSTSVGKATIGAYGAGKNLRTLASLPITNGPWLILTAPSDINQADLNDILRSLKK